MFNNAKQWVFLCGVLLGYFYFDMDEMVTEAVASDASDSLSCQANSLVHLDACRNLKAKTIGPFITLYKVFTIMREVT